MPAQTSISGSVVNTGRGGYHPGVELVEFGYTDSGLSISGGQPISRPANGMRLMINGGSTETEPSTWTTYTNLPAALLGNDKLCTVIVNTTDSDTWTAGQPCRLYMLRSPAWNAVDTTGWTLYLSGQSYGIDGALTNVYYKDFAANTTNPFDDNSAMYIWDFDFDVSVPYAVGGNGWIGLQGTGNTIANTQAPGPTGGIQRFTRDPFNEGPITYSLVSGSLPPGYSLNTTTGLVSGTYPVAGINANNIFYEFTIRAQSKPTTFVDRTYQIRIRVPWLYRQIITTLYMAGGYASSQLWSNVNRFPRATEVCTNLGDGLIDNYHYKPGACSDNKGYVLNGNSTTGFNIRTETKITGLPAPGYTVANGGFQFDSNRTKAYYNGEGIGTTLKFTFATEGYSNLGTGNGGHCAGVSGEFKGLWWFGQPTNYAMRVTYATDTPAAISFYGGAHGQQKGLSSKVGIGYGGNEGDYAGGYNHRKINITNETYGTIGKMMSNMGEENYGMTQDNGYCLGQYNGAQNNLCGRIVYASDATAQLATTVQGHPGASSGHCFWRD